MIREMTDGEWDEAADQFYGAPREPLRECPGCWCSKWACDAYRSAGKACCPDCKHPSVQEELDRQKREGVGVFNQRWRDE